MEDVGVLVKVKVLLGPLVLSRQKQLAASPEVMVATIWGDPNGSWYGESASMSPQCTNTWIFNLVAPREVNMLAGGTANAPEILIPSLFANAGVPEEVAGGFQGAHGIEALGGIADPPANAIEPPSPIPTACSASPGNPPVGKLKLSL